ncbi:MAG: MATE family efflux transporter [bacterium]|nr:MATE family efflux transporter [bacterium]
MNTSNENKMGVMPVNKLMLQMAVPMIISMIIGALYNIVDSLFVAHYSEDALTALSLAFPVQNIILASGIGLGVGISSNLSRYLGEHDKEKVDKSAMNGLLLGAVIYVLILLFGIFGSEHFFRMQTDVEDIISMGTVYTRICCIFSFGQVFSLVLEKILQGTGKTVCTMYMQITGAVVNVILDPILIFGMFGVPKLGVTGAAIATIIGQVTSLLLAIYFNLSKNKEITFSCHNLRPDKKIIGQICSVGVPTIITQSMAGIMSFGLNNILLTFSTTAAAVFGAYFKVQSFVYMAVFALNNALIPIVAFNYGARNGKRIKKAIELSAIYSSVFGIVGTIIIVGFASPIMGMFNASETMKEIGIPALRIMGTTFIFGSFSVMVSYACQGLGKGLSSLLLTATRQFILLLPLAMILGKTMGIKGVWYSFVIAEVVTVIIAAIYLKYIDRKYIETIA